MIDQRSLRAAVSHLKETVPGVSHAAVVSHDGLVLTSTDVDQEHAEVFSAMASEVLTKGEQMTRELSLGDLWGTMIFGTKHGVLSRIINEEMVLIAQVTPSANIGEALGSMNRLVHKLQVD